MTKNEEEALNEYKTAQRTGQIDVFMQYVGDCEFESVSYLLANLEAMKCPEEVKSGIVSKASLRDDIKSDSKESRVLYDYMKEHGLNCCYATGVANNIIRKNIRQAYNDIMENKYGKGSENDYLSSSGFVIDSLCNEHKSCLQYSDYRGVGEHKDWLKSNEVRDNLYEKALLIGRTNALSSLIECSHDRQFVETALEQCTEKFGYDRSSDEIYRAVAGNHDMPPELLDKLSDNLKKVTKISDVACVVKNLAANPNASEEVNKMCVRFDYNFLKFKGKLTQNVARTTKSPEVLDMCIVEAKEISKLGKNNYQDFIFSSALENSCFNSEHIDTMKDILTSEECAKNFENPAYMLKQLNDVQSKKSSTIFDINRVNGNMAMATERRNDNVR